jgi:hypothetical protein
VVRQEVEGWTGKKRDVKSILQHFAERQGYEERMLEVRGFGWLSGSGKGKAFCKETSGGLLFHCWVDTGIYALVEIFDAFASTFA